MLAAILRTARRALLAVAALVALAAASRLVGWIIDVRRPAITRHLPSKLTEAEPEFDRRIKGRFPIGSSVAAMEHDLFNDGFSQPNSFKQTRFVRLDQSAGLLERSFIVSWEADGDRLISVRGSYGLTGP